MTSYYVIPGDTAPDLYMARAAALGCEVCVGDPTQGKVTAFPSVIVMTETLPTAIIPDNTGQATLAEVQAAQAAASAAEAGSAARIAASQTRLQGILATAQGIVSGTTNPDTVTLVELTTAMAAVIVYLAEQLNALRPDARHQA